MSRRGLPYAVALRHRPFIEERPTTRSRTVVRTATAQGIFAAPGAALLDTKNSTSRFRSWGARLPAKAGMLVPPFEMRMTISSRVSRSPMWVRFGPRRPPVPAMRWQLRHPLSWKSRAPSATGPFVVADDVGGQRRRVEVRRPGRPGAEDPERADHDHRASPRARSPRGAGARFAPPCSRGRARRTAAPRRRAARGG